MVPNPIKHGMVWGYQYFWKHPFSVLAAFLWLFMLEGSFTKSGLFFAPGGGRGENRQNYLKKNITFRWIRMMNDATNHGMIVDLKIRFLRTCFFGISRASVQQLWSCTWKMGVQLVQSTYNTVPGRNPANHLGCKQKTVVNNGMNYQPQVMQAGFLNYQQYHLLFGLFSIVFLQIFIHPWLAPGSCQPAFAEGEEYRMLEQLRAMDGFCAFEAMCLRLGSLGKYDYRAVRW